MHLSILSIPSIGLYSSLFVSLFYLYNTNNNNNNNNSSSQNSSSWEYVGEGYEYKYRFRGGKNSKGRRHGLGEYGGDYSDGRRGGYLGMYENGSLKGLGEYRYSDGGVYRGEWSGGDYYDMHGWGEYITPTGVSFKGRWDHNKLNGKDRLDLDGEG